MVSNEIRVYKTANVVYHNYISIYKEDFKEVSTDVRWG